jgi:hypothetical protein
MKSNQLLQTDNPHRCGDRLIYDARLKIAIPRPEDQCLLFGRHDESADRIWFLSSRKCLCIGHYKVLDSAEPAGIGVSLAAGQGLRFH